MEALVRILAPTFNLTIAPEWVHGVAQQLATTLAMADLLDSIDLGDEAQPAPVYRL